MSNHIQKSFRLLDFSEWFRSLLNPGNPVHLYLKQFYSLSKSSTYCFSWMCRGGNLILPLRTSGLPMLSPPSPPICSILLYDHIFCVHCLSLPGVSHTCSMLWHKRKLSYWLKYRHTFFLFYNRNFLDHICIFAVE